MCGEVLLVFEGVRLPKLATVVTSVAVELLSLIDVDPSVPIKIPRSEGLVSLGGLSGTLLRRISLSFSFMLVLTGHRKGGCLVTVH